MDIVLKNSNIFLSGQETNPSVCWNTTNPTAALRSVVKFS